MQDLRIFEFVFVAAKEQRLKNPLVHGLANHPQISIGHRWDAGNIIYKETCTEDICGSFLVPVAEADWDLAVVSQYVLHGGLQPQRLVSSVTVVRSLAITLQYF